MTDLEHADQCAADLIHSCYGQLGCLAILLRMDNGVLRLIAPDGHHKALTMMAYAAGDKLAEHSLQPNIGMRD